MSEEPHAQHDDDEVPTIYGTSPGSEPAAPAGITGHEVPEEGGTPTIYNEADEEGSSHS